MTRGIDPAMPMRRKPSDLEDVKVGAPAFPASDLELCRQPAAQQEGTGNRTVPVNRSPLPLPAAAGQEPAKNGQGKAECR